MSRRMWVWIKLLLGGTVLFGSASVQGCLADALRDLANQTDDQVTLDDVGDDLEAWWDNLWDD